MQVIGQRNNEGVRQLQHPVGPHARFQTRGNRQNLCRNLRKGQVETLTRHTLLGHKSLLNRGRINHLALTLTEGNTATNHHGFLAQMIYGEGDIVVVNTADAHTPSFAMMRRSSIGA